MKVLTSCTQLTQCPGNEWGFPKAPWVPVDVWSVLISMKWWVGQAWGMWDFVATDVSFCFDHLLRVHLF